MRSGCSRFPGTRPTVVDSDSDVDDERLRVGAVPQDVIGALESDLCSESLVDVVDAEVFAMTDDAESDHGRTAAVSSRRVVLSSV